MKIAVFGRQFNADFYEYIKVFFDTLYLVDDKVEIYIHKPFYDFIIKNADIKPPINGFFTSPKDFKHDYDYAFSVGGDGTFLETITYIKKSNIPILGINMGRLGFLASVSKEEIALAIQSLYNKDYEIDNRSLIELETTPQLFGDFNYALNEITIHKQDSSSMIIIHTYLGDDFLNSYWADGLIISTPTGSTAYSMSVGGPIVMPGTNNFIISPIAPHNLNVRPIVVPDNIEITLRVEGRSNNFLVSLDSRSRVFNPTNELKIRKANYNIKVLQSKGNNFSDTLRNKFMWGIDSRNRNH